MSESVIKLNRRPRGIKEHNTYNANVIKGEFSADGLNPKPRKTRDEVIEETRQIKHLEDRIRILETELQHAREESFQAGYDEGCQRTMKEAQNRVEAVQHEMKLLELRFLEALENMEEPLLELAKKLAREVLTMELQTRDDQEQVLRNRLHSLLQDVVEQHSFIVEVHPDHLDKLGKGEIRQMLNLEQDSEVRIRGKAGLEPGELRVTTEDYYVDGTYDNHIDKMADAVEKEKEDDDE